MARVSRNLVPLLTVLLALCGRASAQATAKVTVTGVGAANSGTITISINVSTYNAATTETVTYGPYSTPASIAAAFGLMFTRDYKGEIGLTAGVACSGTASNVITFTLASGTFGAVEIYGSTSSSTLSFNLNASASPPIGFNSVQQFSYANGQLTMSTSLANAQIFYTTDGSAATEASIQNPGTAITVTAGTTVNAVIVNLGSSTAIVQNGQNTWSDWKTNLACYESQCSPYFSQCSSTTSGLCSPTLNFPKPSDCPGGSNTSDQGCLGVQGIPTQVGMTTTPAGTGLPLAIPTIVGETANFSFTTEGYPNSSINGSAGGPSEYYGTQVLWPYNTGNGCDTCTSMVEDFYIWPGQNANSVENWELDMNDWSTTGLVYRGASFQCSALNGGWQYNGQQEPGWQNFYTDYPTDSAKLDHDCPLPTGTLSTSGGISATATSFSVTPNSATSTVEKGMIIWFDDGTNEEVLCQLASGNSCTSALRGWAGTTAQSHAYGAAYLGSVHVQYHVTLLPGWKWTGTSTCSNNPNGYPNWCSAETGECVFIDYLNLNNVAYNFHSLYGTQTVDGTAGLSCLTVPASTLGSTYPDRVFDQKQIDTCPSTGSVCASIGSTASPLQVSEYIDQDNVTASFGIFLDSNGQPLSYSFVIP